MAEEIQRLADDGCPHAEVECCPCGCDEHYLCGGEGGSEEHETDDSSEGEPGEVPGERPWDVGGEG